MRIIHISDNSYPTMGGVERVVHELAKEQTKNGHRVHVFSQHQQIGKLGTETFEYEGVSYTKLPRLTFPILASHYATCFRPNVVHLNSYLCAKSFKNWRTAPVLRHIHDVYGLNSELYFGFGVGMMTPTLERITVDGFESYLVPSESTSRKLRGILSRRKRIWTVPNGVDTQVFRPQPSGELRRRVCASDKSKIIGFVGRIAIGKGALDAYIASAPSLRRYDARLVYLGSSETVVSSGQASAAHLIRKYASRDGLLSKVAFILNPPDTVLARAYSDMDLLVLPSMSEGFGLAAVEAAACGTPCLAYDSGSLPEVIVDKVTGLIVKQGDLPSLAAHVERFASGDLSKEAFTENCIKRGSSYDWKVLASRVDEIYSALQSA